MTYTVRYQRYTEIPVPGKPLGRHAAHDSRSLAYPYRATEPVPITSITHERHAPIFDQSDLGDCVGQAFTGAAATSPVFDALPAAHPALNEEEAAALYSAATRLDAFPGAWPPEDTGTDSVSGAKAAQQAGFISGYLHAATTDDVLQALMTGPVCIGSNWWSSMDNPGGDGVVEITAGAQIRGGHEYLARRIDAERQLIWCDNSWGTSYGMGGSFCFTYATLARLLAEDGDATVPVPISAPAPVPVPVPPSPPDPALARYLADQRIYHWASHRRHGRGEAAYAAAQYLALRSEEAQRVNP